jgi:hypothetical protein
MACEGKGQCCLNLAETWVSEAECRNVTKFSPYLLSKIAQNKPIFSSFTIHGILVRLPEKQTNKLNKSKIPEPDVSVPYLLKLSERFGLALLLRA